MFAARNMMFAGGFDPDAAAYIAAVQAVSSMSYGNQLAVNAFFVGCKADGIWTAIKASCILAAADTLTGALVPLVGTAPTNNGFVSGDYSRILGLLGNGVDKYLNTNRANNADPQNSNHNAAWITATGATTAARIMGGNSATYVSGDNVLVWSNSQFFLRNRMITGVPSLGAPATGLAGTSRSTSPSVSYLCGASSGTASSISQTPSASNVLLFAGGTGSTAPSNARISFYSIGEAINLALLDARLAKLMAALA